jgi:hypothetical protein
MYLHCESFVVQYISRINTQILNELGTNVNWSPWYSWNIAESGVKQNKSNQSNRLKWYDNHLWAVFVDVKKNLIFGGY